MISRFKHKKLTWIDLESPSSEDIEAVAKEFRLPELVAEELVTRTIRAKVDVYKNLIYLVLHFPDINHRHCDSTEQEVDFIIGKNFLITAHYEHSDILHKVSKMFEISSMIEKMGIGEHPGHLFYYLIKEFYKKATSELDEISHDFHKIERLIFEGHEGAMVRTISVVNRKLLDFKQAIRFHTGVLKSFEMAGQKFFEPSFHYYLSVIVGESNKIQNILESQREIVGDLRNTNDSLLSHKTNNTMRTLTMMSFVIFPLALIASIFGMNADAMPIVGSRYDFWIILGLMLLITLATFTFFRRKNWL
jgi:magnesium transporter